MSAATACFNRKPNTPKHLTHSLERCLNRMWREMAALFAVILLLLSVVVLTPVQARAQSACVPGPGDQPETGLQGEVPLSVRQPPNGFQGFWCGMHKVGQNTLFNRGNYGATAISGHCAYSSGRNPIDVTLPTTGVVVLDVSVPANPLMVPDPSNPTGFEILRTPAMLRAYEGLRAQSGILLGSGQDRINVDVYGISQDCLHPQFFSTHITPPVGSFVGVDDNHGGWLHYDGKTFWGVPFVGGNILTEPNRVDVHAVGLDDPANPVDLIRWNRTELPPAILEKTALAGNFHDVTTNFDGTRIYMALYGEMFPSTGGSCDNGMLILDSSDIAFRRPNPQLRFVSWLSWCDQPTPAFGLGTSASAHTTQYAVHQNGKPYVITTDEGPALFQVDANGNCLQRTYSRLIDISDETNPRIIATWNPQVNDAATCAIGAADKLTYYPHYVGVNDEHAFSLVFYAAYFSGVRVVDFSDPAAPKEIGYYNAARNPALTPVTSSDHSAPPIPYDSGNCFLYTGWTDNGLIILELTDPNYNPCMRRAATGGGWLSDSSGGKITFGFQAQRTQQGLGPLGGTLDLNDHAHQVNIHIDQLSFLGSVRDSCGSVPSEANAVQFNGSGTYNGSTATFRVCAQDNGEGGGAQADRVYLTCTSGCNYSAGGAIGGGNIQVRQR